MDHYLQPGIGLQRKPLDLPPTRLAEILTVPVGSARSGSIPDKNTVLLMGSASWSSRVPTPARAPSPRGFPRTRLLPFTTISALSRSCPSAAYPPVALTAHSIVNHSYQTCHTPAVAGDLSWTQCSERIGLPGSFEPLTRTPSSLASLIIRCMSN